MAIEKKASTIEEKLGIVIGKMEGLTGDIQRLNGDLKQHIRDHRSGWFWVIPTIIMLINLIITSMYVFGV